MDDRMLGQYGGAVEMTEAQGLRWGKVIFWMTLAFCVWIIGYVSAPP